MIHQVPGYGERDRACPRCRGGASRIPRNAVDRLLSRFVPVGRYRCESRRCRWEGRLRTTPAPGATAAAQHPGVLGIPRVESRGTQPSTLLLVEQDRAYAMRVRQTLARTGSFGLRIDCVGSFTGALRRLEDDPADVLLVDPALWTAHGVGALQELGARAPRSLVLLLCSATESESLRQTARLGADGYIDKGYLDAHWAPRMMRLMFEHKNALRELRRTQPSLADRAALA